MPFAIVEIATETIVRRYGAQPTSMKIGGRCVVAGDPVPVGTEGLGYRFVELIETDFQKPGRYFDQGSDLQGPLGPISIEITRQWIPWDQARIDAHEADQKDMRGIRAARDAVALHEAQRLALDDTLPDETRTALIGAFRVWRVGEQVEIDMYRRFNTKLYRCIQAHTTQSDWTPPQVPALWSETFAPGTIGPWVQPTGAHDAYALGAQVTHNGSTWTSTVDDNVWEPGVFGWEQTSALSA